MKLRDGGLTSFSLSVCLPAPTSVSVPVCVSVCVPLCWDVCTAAVITLQAARQRHCANCMADLKRKLLKQVCCLIRCHKVVLSNLDEHQCSFRLTAQQLHLFIVFQYQLTLYVGLLLQSFYQQKCKIQP